MKRFFYQQFCFRPGDEDIRRDFEGPAVELPAAENIGEGNAAQQAFKMILECLVLCRGWLNFAMSEDPAFGSVKRVAKQEQR